MGCIEAIIFDVDGVLVDSEPFLAQCLNRAFREKFGVDIPLNTFLALAGTGARCMTDPAKAHGIELDIDEFRTYLFGEIYLRDMAENLKPFPGVVELFSVCREAGLKLAVASNASKPKVLANLSLIALPFVMWDAVLTLEDVKSPKPSPEIYLAMAGKLGIAPGNCSVVEDSPSGIRAARSAGMFTVAVGKSFESETLLEAGADLVKERLADLSVELLTRRGAP